MVAQFLTGVIVGVFIGLLLAPVLRSWVYWELAKRWAHDERSPDEQRTADPAGERPRRR